MSFLEASRRQGAQPSELNHRGTVVRAELQGKEVGTRSDQAAEVQITLS